MSLNVKYKESNNKHLKLVDESDQSILEKIIQNLLLTTKKDIISVLNVGGGFSKSNEKFLCNHNKVSYTVMDLQNNENLSNVIIGDITELNLKIDNTYDLIYSSNTFEHILNPWDATKNIKKLLNNNGVFFCIVPFSWRYHACPYDTYRYSHTGCRYLFEHLSEIKHIFTGYKKMSPNKGWYADKTDQTLDGKLFTESIETYYIAKKDINYKFNMSDFSKGWKRI